LDVDDNATIAMEYDIRSIPTLLFFKDGQIVDRVIGITPKEVIAEKLDSLFTEQVLVYN